VCQTCRSVYVYGCVGVSCICPCICLAYAAAMCRCAPCCRCEHPSSDISLGGISTLPDINERDSTFQQRFMEHVRTLPRGPRNNRELASRIAFDPTDDILAPCFTEPPVARQSPMKSQRSTFRLPFNTDIRVATRAGQRINIRIIPRMHRKQVARLVS